MAAITFPSSPYQYQVYTVGSKSWQWDGSYWVAYYNESPDIVYGTGVDGDATLSTTTGGSSTYSAWATYSSSVFSLTRDVFLNDVTIDANIRLQPNGYRIFIKGILRFSSGSTIGYTSGYSTAGSIQQGGATTGAVGTSVTCSLGGNALATYTATAPTAAQGGTQYWYQPRQAILGYVINASNTTPVFLRGGAGGTTQAGGGVVILAARYISGPSTGTGYIKAPATSPGGGGAILVVSSASALPTTISTDVTGANAGTYVYMQQV
jgi:hypothetical protein